LVTTFPGVVSQFDCGSCASSDARRS
jgi:hypothetical protein